MDIERRPSLSAAFILILTHTENVALNVALFSKMERYLEFRDHWANWRNLFHETNMTYFLQVWVQYSPFREKEKLVVGKRIHDWILLFHDAAFCNWQNVESQISILDTHNLRHGSTQGLATNPIRVRSLWSGLYKARHFAEELHE